VVLRRPLREGVAEEKNSKKKAAKQLTLDLPETTHQGVLYEYAVLVTSLPDEIRTIAQHYRDRGVSADAATLVITVSDEVLRPAIPLQRCFIGIFEGLSPGVFFHFENAMPL
jgi:hypothetical protein